MLHVEGLDIDELGGTAGGEGRELVPRQGDEAQVFQRAQEAVGKGAHGIALDVELLQLNTIGQGFGNRAGH